MILKLKATRNQGFSLIETLIAMCIGTFVSLGAYSAYALLKQNYGHQAGIAHIQENIRMLDILLGDKIKYSAGLGPKTVSVSDVPIDVLNYYQYHHHTVEGKIVQRSGDKNEGAENEEIGGNKGDNYLGTAQSFKDVKPGSDILQLQHLSENNSTYFFLRNTHRVNAQQEPIYSVYQYNSNEGMGELIESVEELHFKYGIPFENGISYYAYKDIPSITQVKMLRAILVLSSIDKKIKKTIQQDWVINKE